MKLHATHVPPASGNNCSQKHSLVFDAIEISHYIDNPSYHNLIAHHILSFIHTTSRRNLRARIDQLLFARRHRVVFQEFPLFGVATNKKNTMSNLRSAYRNNTSYLEPRNKWSRHTRTGALSTKLRFPPTSVVLQSAQRIGEFRTCLLAHLLCAIVTRLVWVDVYVATCTCTLVLGVLRRRWSQPRERHSSPPHDLCKDNIQKRQEKTAAEIRQW